MVVVGPCSGGGFKPQGRGSHNIAVRRRRPILTSVAEAILQLRLSKLRSTMVIWGRLAMVVMCVAGEEQQHFLGKYCIYQIGEEKRMTVSNAFHPLGILSQVEALESKNFHLLPNPEFRELRALQFLTLESREMKSYEPLPDLECLDSKQFSVGKLQAKLNEATTVENSNSAPVLNGPTAASSKEEENLNGKLSDSPTADESSIFAFMTLLCVGLYCLH
ncbi:hypothetical protein RIF29_03414 [Crotalaria pallida]|uniref:Uncharacterized protein n=1 Tax=Crotalaria pallida TaxID=3830 RepID=A0AAN9P9T6_CROPI